MFGLDAPPRVEDPFGELLHAHLAPAAGSDDEERVARIAEEALSAFRALAEVRRTVSLFGSARAGPVQRWGELTRRTSAALARAGFAVITGGGPGLMDAGNEGALEGGGPSIGLSIDLPGQEDPNPHLSLRVPFRYFFLRKLAFVKYACAFVCVPGGYGTLDELFEALNLKRTHRMDPFPVILVGSEYWMELRDWLEQEAVAAGTLSADDLAALELTDDQVSRLEAIRDEHAGAPRQEMEAAMSAHRTAAEALHGDSPDFQAYEDALGEAADRMVRAHVVMARASVQAREVLTAEQRERLHTGMRMMREMMGSPGTRRGMMRRPPMP